MEAITIESFLQAAAVEQILGYENSQSNTAANIQQVGSPINQQKQEYPAYLEQLSPSQTVPNMDGTAPFPDAIDSIEGFVTCKLYIVFKIHFFHVLYVCNLLIDLGIFADYYIFTDKFREVF